jgi:hypothetical protein
MAEGLTVEIGPDRYVVAIGQKFTFGRSQECTHCLDPDDQAISRQAGKILIDNGNWFVYNVSSSHQLDIVDHLGMRSVLGPGRRFALEGRMRIMVQCGKAKPHVLFVHAPDPVPIHVSPATSGVSTVGGVPLTMEERLAMIALFAGYLMDGDQYDPHPRSYDAVAKRLDWTRTKVVRKIEYLRERLSAAGVPNMNGGFALNNLAEYVLTQKWITKADLRLLPGMRPGQDAR